MGCDEGGESDHCMIYELSKAVARFGYHQAKNIRKLFLVFYNLIPLHLSKPEEYDKIITIYLKDSPVHLQSLESALQSRDPEALWQAAHSLKTNNSSVGAVRMAEICSKLEVKGREGDLDNSEQLLAELKNEFTYIEKKLQGI